MIFLIIFCILVCILDFIKNKNYFSPLFIFNFIWAFTLGLYELKISELQHDLSNRTILIFWVCVIAYNFAVLFCQYTKLDKIKIKFNKKNKNQYEEIDDNSEKIKKRVKIARNIAIIIFLVEIIYSKGLPIIWKLLGSSKGYFDFGIPSINGAWYGLIILLGAYSFANKTKDRYLYLAIGLVIISRQIIMSILIEAIVYMLLKREIKVDKKKIIVLIFIVIIGFSVLGNFRSGNSTMDDIFYAKEKYQDIPTAIKWIYSYMTFSITNVDNLINLTDGAVNYGASMLHDVIPTILLDFINVKVNYSPYYLELINFNVSTYLPSIYLDFGIIGIAIFNFLMGFLGIKLYKKNVLNNTTKNVLLYAVFVHNVVLLFFTNMFLYLPITVQFLYIYLIFNNKERNDKNVSKCNNTSL